MSPMVMAAGVVTVGFTVIVRVAAVDGPLQPVLTALIVTVPDQPTGQVTTPVLELISEVDKVPEVLVMPLNDHNNVPTVVVLL